MKNLTFLFTLLSIFFLYSCDDDNSNQITEEFTIEDKTYRLTSLILTEPVDINGDGIYALDIFDENPCLDTFSYSLYFLEEKSIHPAWTGFALKVEPDSNGVLEQIATCGFLDGVLPFWQRNGNTLIFYYDTWESPDILGELSDDGQQITFNAASDSGALFKREILKEDGTVIEYEDNIKLIYTLEE